jgi:hypothetical protein
LREVLALTPEKPLYGHRSGKKAQTHWVAFLKPNAADERRKPNEEVDVTNDWLHWLYWSR